MVSPINLDLFGCRAGGRWQTISRRPVSSARRCNGAPEVEPEDYIVDLESQEPALLQAWEPQQKEERKTDAMGV